MCCDVDTCCCCIDHRSGVKALGAISAIICIIGLIAGIVMMENERKIINECAENTAFTQHHNDSRLDVVVCGDKKEFSRQDIQGFVY